MSTNVTELSPTIGVEVSGLTGASFIDRVVADECLTLLEKHGVVVYHNAHLDDDDLVAFSQLLGEVVTNPRTGEYVQTISLDPEKGSFAAYLRGTFFWHIDGAQDLVPQKASLLVAHAVADEGGDTEFANTYAAYDALSNDEKAELEGVRVEHTIAASQRLIHPDPTPKQEADWATVPAREHPLVWTRPNGRKSLLIGATTDHVIDRSPEEGRALLDRLLEWSTQPQFVLRHHWSPGDLVIWDNTGVLHRALPYEPTGPRLLHRTTLVGEHAVA